MTTKISTLPTLATVTDATIIPVVEGGATKRITGLALKTYTGTASGPQGPSGPSGVTGSNGASGPSGPSGAAGSGASAATPTALGTVVGATAASNSGLTSLGYNSAVSASGSYCVGVGTRSLGFTGPNTGSYNTAVGADSLYALTSGVGNAAFGYNSMGSHTTGNYNAAFGYDCLSRNTTAADNAAFGAEALRLNTTGTGNTAIGRYALTNNTTSANNVAVGYQSLYSVTNATGTHTAVGYQALYSATDNSNTAFGYRAGYGITSGHNNVCLGKDAGNGSVVLTTGAQNVIIGSGAYGSNGANYTEIVIGFGCNGVGGDYVTLGKLNNRVYCHYDTNATWTQSSDVRLKKDIEDDTLGLAFIDRLRPVKYRWKATNELEQDNPQYNETNNKNTEAVMHGLIAQEVKAALDAEGVDTFGGWDVEPNGIQGISREMFISPLIKAVQELKALVEAQAIEIAALKAKVN